MAAVLGLAGSIVQASAASSAAKAQAKSLEFQAAVQKQQADREKQIGAAEKARFERAQSRARASGIAQAGGAGVDVSTGSPLLADIDLQTETDLTGRQILNTAATRAKRLEQQAVLSGFEAKNARKAGRLQAFSSLLSGLNSFAGPGSQSSFGFLG